MKTHLAAAPTGDRSRTARLAITGGLVAVAMALALACTSTGGPGSPEARRAVILDSIRFVESGGIDSCPDGDGGRAIGPFQIHEVYWRDAVEADPSLGREAGFGYQDCRRRDYAHLVVEAYMQRYAPDAWDSADAEVIARIHNGGPRGAEKSSTAGYWRRVESVLKARGR